MFHLDQRTTNFRPWLKARPRSLLLFQEHISKYFISLICLMCWFCPRQVSFNSKFKQELSVSQSLISPPICFGWLPPTEATLFLSRTVDAICHCCLQRSTWKGGFICGEAKGQNPEWGTSQFITFPYCGAIKINITPICHKILGILVLPTSIKLVSTLWWSCPKC